MGIVITLISGEFSYIDSIFAQSGNTFGRGRGGDIGSQGSQGERGLLEGVVLEWANYAQHIFWQEFYQLIQPAVHLESVHQNLAHQNHFFKIY